ncbi:murein biosynthesis integral membrane protein MurJ [Cryobacterium sp. BB736]|uniref:murein biosynthesis integral membrane protein MurJ n=1 Tax=Cryobacterium sp. BB736 TaxID=2746963 RepID=UPI00351C4F74
MSETDDAAGVPDSKIGRASAVMATGTIVSRILGFVKAAVLAATIGQVGSAAADAFTIANGLPNNIYALIAGGMLSAVLVPQIVRSALHADGGQRFINKLVTLGITVFVILTIIATLCAPLLIDLYTNDPDPEVFALATAFAYWCLPQILFYALYTLLGEVLNARGVFGPFMWAPILNNVVAIAGLVAFQVLFGSGTQFHSPDVWTPGMVGLLGASATLGVAAQALILGVFWKRARLGFRPDFKWRGVGLSRTGRTASWAFAMILVTQIAGIVQTQVVFQAAGAGASATTLQNAFLIFMLPHSVVTVSLVTAYFTRMSGHASAGNLAGVRSDVSSSLRSIGLVMVFATIALMVVAYPVSVFFESDVDKIRAMGNVIIALLLSLVPFSAVFVMQRVFYALEDTRTVFLIEVAKQSVFVAGALVAGTLPLEWIGVGVAVATSIAVTAQLVITFAVLRRKLGSIDGRRIAVRYLEYLGAALAAGAVGFGLLWLLGGLWPAGFALSGMGAAALTIVGLGTLMSLIYVGLLALFKNSELAPVLRSLTDRFSRSR